MKILIVFLLVIVFSIPALAQTSSLEVLPGSLDYTDLSQDEKKDK